MVVPEETTVQFIDFGNTEAVEVVYQHPACIGLELAPAAAEVVLARCLVSTGEAKKKVLEDCLMGEEEKSLELQLERDSETGMQVARFYEDGVEVIFDNKIEPVADVVVEAVVEENLEVKIEPDINKNFTSEDLKVMEVRRPLVEADALPKDGSIPVVLVLVEDVRKVWVIKKELEQKLDKMAEALQRQASKLESVQNPGIGCVYATKFSQDQQMYRAVVEKAEGHMVTVRFIDFGNREMKDKSELLQLSEKMAKWPAVAHPIILEENKVAEDSQTNRDEVEDVLDQDLDLEVVLKEGRVVRLESGGEPVNFSFNKKSARRGKDDIEAKEKMMVGSGKPVAKSKEPEGESKPVRKLEQVTTPVKMLDGDTSTSAKFGKNRSTTTTPSSGSTSESPLEVFDRMEEVIADPVQPAVVACKEPPEVGGGHVRVKTDVSGKVELMADAKRMKTSSASMAAEDGAEPAVARESNAKTRHSDKTTYIPPALRRAAQPRDQSTKRCPEVSPGTVAALKSMLEKELPQVTRGKGDGEEKGPKPQSYGTKKVNDWFARNEAVRIKEQAGVNCDLLTDEKFELAEAPLGSSSPCKKKEGTEEAGVEVNLAMETLNRMLKHAPAAALMTTRETSVALQELVPLLTANALQPLFDGASDNFEMVSTHPSGCRVIQALLKSNGNCHQFDQLTCHLEEEPASLIKLAMDKFGTFVAQESLNHMVKTPGAVLGVVKAIRGKMNRLGSNLHASFFLQKLLAVARGEASNCLLQEEILANIRLLAFSEVRLHS